MASSTAKGLSTRIADEVRRQLSESGFTRRLRSGLSTIELSPNVLGRVGLNTAHEGYRRAVEVNPVMIVTHLEVERIVADLRGVRFRPHQVATASRPIGYLMPERRYVMWLFDAESIQERAADLVAAVRDYGVPAMRSAIELPDLLLRIAEGWGVQHLLAYRLPVIRMLLGDREGALGELARARARVADQAGTYADEFRAYAVAFEKRYGSAQ